jgi:hypothetical protein
MTEHRSTHLNEEEHPFYGVEVIRRSQQEYINNLLKKYKGEPVNDELKAKIWDELQMEKYKGNVTIPFKVVMRRDSSKNFPDYIEIILDTKV